MNRMILQCVNMIAGLKVLQVFVLNLAVGVEFSSCLKDFFIVHRYSGDEYFCITNSSFALSWNVGVEINETEKLKQVSKFLPVSHNYWTVECKDFYQQQWQCQTFVSREIIRDRRWEEIEVYKTDYLEDKSNPLSPLLFTTVNETLSDDFQLALSIRIDPEAHIFLCEGYNVTNSNCYWLILQGFNGQKSGIRKCPANTILPTNGKSPKEPCRTLKKEINHSSRFLSKEKWEHFVLSRDQNRLIFKNSKGEEILSYEDLKDIYRTKYLIIHSRRSTGLWKIHKFQYFETTQSKSTEFMTPVNLIDGHICMSMFVRMCKTCKMRIEIKNVNNKNEVLLEETYTSKQQTGWSEITFTKSIVNATQVLFSVKTFNENEDRKQFWAMSDVKQCHKDGFRMIQFDKMTPCQLMVPESKVISLNNEISATSVMSEVNHCEGETVSKSCIPCDWFLKGNCGALKICEQFSNEFICSCSAGYQDDGYNCVNPCSGNTYGPQCKKHCSRHCYNCNKVDGTCASCLNEYKGLKCNIPPAPILKNAPKISNGAYTNAIVMENVDVLSSEFNDSDEVPVMASTTRCDELKEEDVVVKPSQTTVNFTALEERQSYICAYKFSKLTLEPAHDSKYNLSLSYHSKPFNLLLRGLSPSEYYKVTITINEGKNYTITKSFTTADAIPERVENLSGIPISDTTVELKWEKPALIYGDIEYYVVKSKIERYLACNNNSVTYDTVSIIETTTTSAIVSNLNPYTKYKFYVFAKNREYDGPSTYITVNTFPSDSISDEEIPKLESKKTYNRSVLLQFSKISCSKFKGPLLIAITLKCSEQWCTRNKTQKLEYSQSSVKKEISVLPFSSYTLILKFCRNASVCSPVTKQYRFQTDVTSPNIITNLSVFSKNTTSISVRWQPPYPSTGILELYNIRSVLKSSNERRDLGNVSNSPCNLWPEFQCFTLTGLQANQIYSVQLRAKNEKPDSFGQVTATEAITKTEPSRRPPGLEILWTLDNDLRITWEHPNEANGDITHFNISVLSSLSNQKPQIYETLQVTKEQYTAKYHVDVPADKLLPSTEYKISVRAFNGLEGEEAFLMDFSPPEIPTFKTEPKFQTSNHSIEVETYGLQNFTKNNKYKLFIVLSDEYTETISHPAELQMFKNKLSKFRSIFTCNQYNASEKFVIGRSSNSTTNCKANETLNLRPGSHYTVTIVLTNTDRNKTSYKFYTHEAYTSGKAPEEPKDLTLLALLTLLLIIPIAIIIFYKRRSIVEKVTSLKKNIFGDDSKLREEETPLATVPRTINRTQEMSPTVKPNASVKEANKQVLEQIGKGYIEKGTDPVYAQVKPKNNRNKNTVETRQNANHCSRLVPAKYFKGYFKTALENHELKDQYESILKSIVAYEVIAGDTLQSEYVNMDFNSGLQIKNAYFITKLPVPSQFNKFWKTVCNENINHIILFAHFYSNQEENINYWPDVGESLDCGDVTIECNLSQKYTFYTYRKFSLKCKNKIRKVHQLHLALPLNDKRYLSSLNYVEFFQKMSKIPLSSKSPILVHSSSGMRGSSFALLCNISLRNAQKDGVIDVMANCQRLLQITNDMKIDFDHYVAAHAIIADTLHHRTTSIACYSLRGSKTELFTSNEIQKHLQYLKDTLWLDGIEVEQNKDVYVRSFPLKNGQHDEQHKVSSHHLSQFEHSDFIRVCGFKTPEKFWVAKQPASMPLSDFFENVLDKKIYVIVTLNDNIFTWPSEEHPEIFVNDDITMKYKCVKKLKSHDWLTLELTTKTKRQFIEVLTFRKWSAPVLSLPKVADFVDFVMETHEIFKNSGPVLVTCHDGRTSCGLYLAMSYNIQQIKTENICDVCTCIRTLRRHCCDYLKDEKEYIFLLEAAHIYMKQCSLYEVR